MKDFTSPTDGADLTPQQANERLNQQLQDLVQRQRQESRPTPPADTNTTSLVQQNGLQLEKSQQEPPDKNPQTRFSILSGYATHHFQQQRYDGVHFYNGANTGIGLQYDLNRDLGVAAQTYKNSVNRQSYALGIKYKPLHVGPVDAGFVVGAISGYPRVNHGGFFPAVVPEFTLNLSPRTALNFDYVPPLKGPHGSKVATSLSMQFQFKF